VSTSTQLDACTLQKFKCRTLAVTADGKVTTSKAKSWLLASSQVFRLRQSRWPTQCELRSALDR
jgi:hypothetical protein